MTQHYLAGEMSLLLERLHAAVTNPAVAAEIAHLRYRAETEPLTALTAVAVHALEVAGCWDALTDAASFARHAAACADLWEFSLCAGLLSEPRARPRTLRPLRRRQRGRMLRAWRGTVNPAADARRPGNESRSTRARPRVPGPSGQQVRQFQKKRKPSSPAGWPTTS